MSDAPGFLTTGDIGNVAAEAQGSDLIPSTAGEAASAVFQQGLANNITPRLFRQIGRNLPAYPRTMQPEEANGTFGIEGRLSFDQPVTMDVARDLHDHHHANALREDVIARRNGGVGSGGVARFGIGFAAAVLDPLNVASAFIPFVGEARVAAMLGTAARGATGRALVRGIEGAGQGLLGAAALEPANYWLSQNDQDDYTMGDALTNLAFGTVLGGFLHGGLGALRDRRALPPWSPEMHEAAMRQGAAAIAEGRPVQAAAAMEFTAARAARTELEQWYASVKRVEREADAALEGVDARTAGVASVRNRLVGLRDDADSLRIDIEEAQGRLADAGLDAETKTRIAEVDAELSGAIPRQRRAALERERTMLLEGRDSAAEASATNPLEAGRSEAEIAGLSRAEGRTNSALALAESALDRAMQARSAAARIFNHKAAALASREALTLELAARTLRRAAARLGVRLEEGEAAEMASKVLRAPREDAKVVMDGVLSDLSKRASYGPYQPDDVILTPGVAQVARTVDNLRAAEARGEDALREGLRGAPEPRDVEAERASQAIMDRAPKAEGDNAAQIAELDKMNQELGDTLAAEERAFAESEKLAGREPPKPDPEIEAANEAAKEGESMAKAFEAAAVCAIGRA